MTIAVVTDSTSYLPSDLANEHGIRVVPLHVMVGGKEFREGVDVSAGQVAAALRAFTPVSTSRPAPQAFLDAYEAAAADGATGIVSISISADMSSTIGSAQLAAAEASIPVTVVDSRVMGMAMAYAAVSAAESAASGATIEEVADAARRRCEASTVAFYVDTLEYLRRGGRIGAASAMVGSALAIKPILGLRDGNIVPLARVRTSSKAISRLAEIAAEAATNLPAGAVGVDVAVHHLDSADRAASLAGELRGRLGMGEELRVVELGAVVGAHVGPGTLAIVVSPQLS
ncbi:MAG: DegV family protein [Nostocoides sp.]